MQPSWLSLKYRLQIGTLGGFSLQETTLSQTGAPYMGGRFEPFLPCKGLGRVQKQESPGMAVWVGADITSIATSSPTPGCFHQTYELAIWSTALYKCLPAWTFGVLFIQVQSMEYFACNTFGFPAIMAMQSGQSVVSRRQYQRQLSCIKIFPWFKMTR